MDGFETMCNHIFCYVLEIDFQNGCQTFSCWRMSHCYNEFWVMFCGRTLLLNKVTDPIQSLYSRTTALSSLLTCHITVTQVTIVRHWHRRKSRRWWKSRWFMVQFFRTCWIYLKITKTAREHDVKFIVKYAFSIKSSFLKSAITYLQPDLSPSPNWLKPSMQIVVKLWYIVVTDQIDELGHCKRLHKKRGHSVCKAVSQFTVHNSRHAACFRNCFRQANSEYPLQ